MVGRKGEIFGQNRNKKGSFLVQRTANPVISSTAVSLNRKGSDFKSIGAKLLGGCGKSQNREGNHPSAAKAALIIEALRRD